jgi:hypothetical protein
MAEAARGGFEKGGENAAMVGSFTEIITGGVIFVATGWAFSGTTSVLAGEVAANVTAGKVGTALVGSLDVARGGAMTLFGTATGIGLMAQGSYNRLNALNQYDRDLATCNAQSGYQYVTLPGWLE